ncbi:MAG: Phage virion morphosis family [Pseudomonadota bacterium]|jgi:phage gpG-like protein
MADTTYTLSGDELAQVMASLSERARSIMASRDMIARPFDYRKPLSTIALYLASQARQCIDQSRDPDGQSYAPLKNPSKRRGGASAKPLHDKGFLIASLVGQGVGHVADIAGATLTYGTNLTSAKGFPYPSVHQLGSSTTPARAFLGITDAMKARIRLIVIDWLEREQ